jgi:hypothetical protein
MNTPRTTSAGCLALLLFLIGLLVATFSPAPTLAGPMPLSPATDLSAFLSDHPLERWKESGDEGRCLTCSSPSSASPAAADDGWDDRFYRAGMNDWVNTFVLDETGDLYVGGYFTTAGDVTVNHIARWDGERWHALGTGMDRPVHALALDGAGNLLAAGDFTTAGGVAARYVARWDGVDWHPVGGGLDGWVSALVVDEAGNVYAGGTFTTVGGVAVNHIARWDGSRWHPLGSGMSAGWRDAYVSALAVDGAGNLVAAGRFTTAGGVTVNHIARWDGERWHPLGTGLDAGDVSALVLDGTGTLYIGGMFTMVGGVTVNNIARWDGERWHSLNGGVSGWVDTLVVDEGGNLLAGGTFATAGDAEVNYVAVWDGSQWSPLGAGLSAGRIWTRVRALAVDDKGTVFAGGNFTIAGDEVEANYIASWNSGHWEALGSGGSGMNRWVNALAVDATGNLYAGGEFTLAGDAASYGIARWDGSRWHPLGTGMDGPVSTLVVDAADDLIAGGTFTRAGGVVANYIARWDGSRWHPLGSGMSTSRFGASIFALAVDASGSLYAGGIFTRAGDVEASGIARWDGVNWHPLGAGLGGEVSPYLNAVVVDEAGHLYVGGQFSTAGDVTAYHIARWDGSHWSPVGTGVRGGAAPSVQALALDEMGRLYIGGWFTLAGGRPSWNIASWRSQVAYLPLVSQRVR